MKKNTFLVLAVIAQFSSFGQFSPQKVNSYTISAQYTHEFVLDGYVRVREWEYMGDKIKLKDLGMTSYPALQFQFEKLLRKNRRIGITYDRFLMSGTSTFNRDIIYNGTVINGRNGIDVSPTRYYRITASFTGPLVDHAQFDLNYKVSLVVDHITFYLDGDVSPQSPKDEVYEGFGRQAFPYPVFGLEGRIAVDPKSNLNFEVDGTYIPRFKSFYSEGGKVYLQYKNFLADLRYSRTVKDFELNAGVKLRYLYLFQESLEDTNIISTLTFGPYLGLAYHF